MPKKSNKLDKKIQQSESSSDDDTFTLDLKQLSKKPKEFKKEADKKPKANQSREEKAKSLKLLTDMALEINTLKEEINNLKNRDKKPDNILPHSNASAFEKKEIPKPKNNRDFSL